MTQRTVNDMTTRTRFGKAMIGAGFQFDAASAPALNDVGVDAEAFILVLGFQHDRVEQFDGEHVAHEYMGVGEWDGIRVRINRRSGGDDTVALL